MASEADPVLLFFSALNDEAEKLFRDNDIEIVALSVDFDWKGETILFWVEVQLPFGKDVPPGFPGQISADKLFDSFCEKYPRLAEVNFDEDFKKRKVVRIQAAAPGFVDKKSQFLTEEAGGAIRPCPAGVLVSAGDNSSLKSTLTANMKYGGPFTAIGNHLKEKAIGCNHGLCENIQLNKGIYQPPYQMASNRIAKGIQLTPIQYEEDEPASIDECAFTNHYDVVWASTMPGETINSILEIGQPAGIRLPKITDQYVDIHGAASGLISNVRILSFDLKYISQNYASKYSCWHSGIKLDKHVTQQGDSGAAYVSTDDSFVIGNHRGVFGGKSVGAPLLS